ncbi:MAG: bifunctional riboflavin kinase/FAD synthetase, partial [Kiritimatiellaceae bacterium]|nr:bifunctional riboflavin kinase/FAD synthetase [Kiritimatiellaceae bacterium]
GHTEFLVALREGLPQLRGIVCGADWSFGFKALGKFNDLEQFCLQHGLTATAVAPVLFQGERISSTHVRQAIRDGNVLYAGQLLGRSFSLAGTVVPGRAIGRELGYPTANIASDKELIPAPGIYAAYTSIEASLEDCDSVDRHPSAVFIGERSTFQDTEPVIESYLLDFQGDLYGRSIEVYFVEKIRDVYPFSSKEQLIEQMARDVVQVRDVLAGRDIR